MMVNFTLIVQGIHFLCAYVILTNIFFRPAWRAYQAQLAQLARLREARAAAVSECDIRREQFAQERTLLFARLREQLPIIALRAPPPISEGDYHPSHKKIHDDHDLLVSKIVTDVEKR